MCRLCLFTDIRGASHYPEALAKTAHLFDAVLGELAAVAGRST